MVLSATLRVVGVRVFAYVRATLVRGALRRRAQPGVVVDDDDRVVGVVTVEQIAATLRDSRRAPAA
jgi:hypothetical protein